MVTNQTGKRLMPSKTKAQVWLDGLNSLRLTVKEAIEMIPYSPEVAIAMLEAAHENTNPILLEQNCGCSK